MIDRMDGWIGRTLFVPLIIRWCQAARMTQYAVSKYLWAIAFMYALVTLPRITTFDWVVWVIMALCAFAAIVRAALMPDSPQAPTGRYGCYGRWPKSSSRSSIFVSAGMAGRHGNTSTMS
jgi:hypothetical protein